MITGLKVGDKIIIQGDTRTVISINRSSDNLDEFAVLDKSHDCLIKQPSRFIGISEWRPAKLNWKKIIKGEK